MDLDAPTGRRYRKFALRVDPGCGVGLDGDLSDSRPFHSNFEACGGELIPEIEGND